MDVDSALKALYKQDSVPKYYTIYFASIPLTINTASTNDKIVSGSFSLEESLCSDTDLVFGSCEASEIKFTVADITQDLTGLEFTITQTVGAYTTAFGTYKVDSCKKQDDLRFKDIIAYDSMTKFDIDVSAWYNALVFTGLTLSAFRASLCAEIGLTEATAPALPNDSMSVEKTIEPTQLSGRNTLKAIEEINGAFGHINRLGQLSHVVLKPAYGLHPSKTLHPSVNLHPIAANNTTYVQPGTIAETITKDMYRPPLKFEEYTVKEIDKLIIRQEEDDVGAIVGTGTNAYIIEGNFLVFGKGATELAIIATNAFGNIAKRPYRPYQSEEIGLPYLEVGDMKEYATDDVVRGYMFQRTLTGIQSLKDACTAEGSEQREQNFGLNYQIQQLKGKAAIITKNVEEVAVSVIDLDLQLTGEMNVLAGQVILKVMSDGKIGVVALSADADTGTAVKIAADSITLEGLITLNGNTMVLADGTLKVVNADISGTLTSPIINGGTINGTRILSTSWDGTTYGGNTNEILIENGTLKCSRTVHVNESDWTYTWATTMTYDTFTTEHVVCTTLTISGVAPVMPSALQDYVGIDYFDGIMGGIFTRLHDLDGL